MRNQKTLSLLQKNNVGRNSVSTYKPVWSKQHGAYITLITAWLIGTLLSDRLSILHPVILIMLLTGFNFIELLIDTLKRKSGQQHHRLLWMGVYGILSTVMAGVLFFSSPFFKTMLPVFIVSGVIMLTLNLKRAHKTIPVELITFGVFSLAGLIAYNPSKLIAYNQFFELWLLLTAYFGLSVFQVKSRIKEISVIPVMIYTAAIISLFIMIFGITLPVLLVGSLMLIKTSVLLVLSNWYRSLRIKSVGYMEMVFQFLFVLIFVVAY